MELNGRIVKREQNKQHLDQDHRRLVVRNGYHPPRSIQSGGGSIQVRQPRVNDRRTDEQGNRFRFTSKILPPYLRKTKAIEELVPWLYLKGISTSDFPEALACFVVALYAKDKPVTWNLQEKRPVRDVNVPLSYQWYVRSTPYCPPRQPRPSRLHHLAATSRLRS